jgi:hypothetical protein
LAHGRGPSTARHGHGARRRTLPRHLRRRDVSRVSAGTSSGGHAQGGDRDTERNRTRKQDARRAGFVTAPIFVAAAPSWSRRAGAGGIAQAFRVAVHISSSVQPAASGAGAGGLGGRGSVNDKLPSAASRRIVQPVNARPSAARGGPESESHWQGCGRGFEIGPVWSLAVLPVARGIARHCAQRPVRSESAQEMARERRAICPIATRRPAVRCGPGSRAVRWRMFAQRARCT